MHNKTNRLVALGSYLALACGGITMGNGCALEPTEDQAATESVSINVRFYNDDEQQAQSALGKDQLSLSFLPLAALAPIERTDVTRILVDVTYADSGQPFAINFALTELTEGTWEGTLPFLPRDQSLRFSARALDAEDVELFSGETLATLTIDNQGVEIPLAPAQDQQEFDMPRMYRVVYPSEIVAGQEVQIIFTIRGNAGETIDYAITSDDGSSPFSPAAGSVTLTNTVVDFITLYTAPEVDQETPLSHQVVITSADSLSSVAIATDFVTTIIPRPDSVDGVVNTTPTVRFNPVVLELEANGTVIPDAVELTADVSDDTASENLVFQWSYTPNTGTPDATFANGGAGNPAIFQGYTVEHQGTITLEVTDEDGGTTTLFYELLPDQFADAIDHGSANGIKKIVAGVAHTCVLTGEGKVRCWGDAQSGQLGYGNATDIGDAPERLPHTAGDVPLPEPVVQLVAGGNHTCALLESGLVYCWGDNGLGQLGYNTTDDLGDGEPVTSFGYVTLGGLASKIAAGGNHTCAILQDSGALRCWGYNAYGQLGHGHVESIGDNENVFTQGNVELGAAITDIALGGDHTCALLASGNIRCWGRNTHGQLGYGSNVSIGDNETLENLADVSLPGPVRKIAAGDLHTCVHLENGAMRCWGNNSYSQLGYGFGNTNHGDQSGEFPLQLADIAVGAVVTDIAVGHRHTCALLSNGALKCWGYGANGRLGYGNQSNQGIPPANGVDLDDTSAYQIAAGGAHTCALRSNGTARCWGAGASGRLGHGATTDAYSPDASGDIAILAAPTE